MATASANVALNITGNAQQQLAKTQKSVENLQKGFAGLRNVLGTIAIGNILSNIVRTADAMDDLGKATGLSIATVTGLGDAIKASGGEVQDAVGVLGKFSQSLEEGRQGTIKAEYQFEKLGISISELRSLSDEDILRKTIEGLAKLPAGAERTALAMELLGKQARFLDFNNLNASLDQFINNARKAEPGTKALADLMGNLEGIGRSFSQQLIANGTGFAETLVKLTQNTDQIAKSLVELTRIITILGAAFTIFNKVLPGVKLIKDGIAGITKITAFAKLSNDITFAANNFKRFLGLLPSAYSGIQSLGFALGNVGILLTRLSGYGLLIYGLGEAFKALTGTINPVAKAFEFLRDIGVVVLAQLKREWDLLVESFKAWTELLGLRDAIEFVAESIVPLFSGPLDWLESKLQGISSYWKQTVRDAEQVLGIAEDFSKPLVIQGEGAQAMPKDFFTKGREERSKAAKEQQTELQLLKQGIDNSTQSFIRQKEAQLGVLQAQASFVNMSQETKDILDAQRNVYDEFNTKIEEYENKIKELKPEQEKLKGTYLAQIEVLKKTRDAQMVQATDAVIATQQQIDAQRNLQAELQRTFEQYRADTALADLQAELDLMGLQGDELEKQQRFLSIQQQMRDKVISAVEGLISLEQRKGLISDEQYKREKSNLEQQLDIARQVAEGKLAIEEDYWKRRQQIENDATGAAKQAATTYQQGWSKAATAVKATDSVIQNLEGALDQFVNTGKIKFSDLTKSILADLAKIALKAALSPIFSAIGSKIGGFIGSIFGIPMLATGGPANAGKPYIVGEKGPELFVPKSAGTVIPNNKLSAGTEAMASGKVNAPVTNNYNTYNINALDAKSVAQLFAENRKSLLGATETARRELAYGS